ncbi:hypothetical protein [Paenibacillus sp. MBLB4367]|uniref:hypothetical protein n=1 Tax=Paenibacillus sp. MBLB4367 TaxID=3384767 RepID=UPI0039082E6C
MKLIGSKTEKDCREQLIKAHKSLFIDKDKMRLLAVLRTCFPNMKTAYIIKWLPEQGEDIFTILINNNVIARVELDRNDLNTAPIIESEPLDKHYKKGLRKMSQIILAVALDLANRDLDVKPEHLYYEK